MPVVRPPEVTVSQPVEKEVVDNYYFDGYTAAVETVDIRARVTGYLSEILFTDGELVKKDQRLFVIDPRPYKAALDQARAEEGRTQALLKRLTADFARAEKLLPQRTISQEEFDKIAGDLAQARAEIRAREAAVEQAELNFHFAGITAPIAGRISRTLVTVGNLVIANETLLTTIVSIDPIYVYFDVDEPTVLRLQQMIREGKLEPRSKTAPVVHLGLDTDTGYPFTGHIDFVENRIDPHTGTLKIRAVFENNEGTLSPGLHARVEVPIGKPHKALMITERAIGTTQGQKYVYVVDDKNVVHYRAVTLGLLDNRMRVVTAGLEPSDRVVVGGMQRVREGITVDPKPADMTAYTSPGTAPPEVAER